MSYQGYPSYQGSKFNASTSIRDPMFCDYPFTTENFHDYHIHDHHSLKFPQLQISRVRHPNVCWTYATPFLHDSCRRQKLLKTSFLMVIILNRHVIPHCLDLPRVAHTYGQTSL